ncbi:MAG TPA: flagellar basal body rod protein FlgB [Candidatus Hydrogenedentes bacterium]|nr:flagellar basal body rod protein FlgB [Candidatus Hydrogenedentota bacterium]HOS03734.1 flagellar basal body rod protein FlgB [Candidatus Hydrogenedentota bacterium]
MGAFAGVDAVTVLRQGLRVAQMNHRVIANNVANVETPNYNSVSLDFQKTLRAAIEGRDRVSLRKTQDRHLDGARELPEFEHLAILSKNDYNKVDLDTEMAKLSENTGKYMLYSSLVVKHFQQVKNLLNNIR